MTRLCRWCNARLSTEEGARQSGRRIAESLCAACSEHFVFQMGVPFQTFIDSLPAPIFVLDGDAVVRGANTLGHRLLGKKRPDQAETGLAGDVFECAYARLPEGCGKTIHCSGCAIRRSVYQTFETGESLINVPATLRYGDPSDPQPVAMRISTEKMGDVVLLRIDRMDKKPS